MIFETIAEVIADRNGYDAAGITPETKFADLGIDSHDTVEMLMNLEEKLGIEIDMDQKVETVGDLVAYIEGKLK